MNTLVPLFKLATFSDIESGNKEASFNIPITSFFCLPRECEMPCCSFGGLPATHFFSSLAGHGYTVVMRAAAVSMSRFIDPILLLLGPRWTDH